MRISLKVKTALLSVILIWALFLALTKGPANIPLRELLLIENRQILYLRIMRLLAAIVTGSGLAVSGIALQAILRNPLAEPYLLGTSSGAGLGAVIATTIGLGAVYLPLAAFIGAIASVGLVYVIARHGGKIPVQSLILSGVIVSVALSGIIVFLISVAGDKTVHGLMWWLWGSLEAYDLKLFCVVSVVVLTGIIAIFICAQDLNAMCIGEEEAMHLGIRTDALKAMLFFVTSLITSSLVCITGVIGFVGLVIPHIMRLAVGPDHRVLIPSACLAASVFMVACDLFSRALFAPLEIPIGVITAVIGAPIFIVLMKTREGVK